MKNRKVSHMHKHAIQIFSIQFKNIYYLLYVHGFFCLHVCLWTMCIPGIHRDQKKVSSLALELQTFVNLLWVLGIKYGSFVGVMSALNHRNVLSLPRLTFKESLLFRCEINSCFLFFSSKKVMIRIHM